MKIETEFPYNEYDGYIVINKENRRHVCLVHKVSKKRTTISYARYLMAVSEKRILEKYEHVDHIDNDKTNDVISNLQILSITENNKKYRDYAGIIEEKITLICPICNVSFEKLSSDVLHKIKKGKTPTCSRSCGGKMSSLNTVKKSQYDLTSIKKDKLNGMTNKDIMIKHNISSRGTLQYLLNKK